MELGDGRRGAGRGGGGAAGARRAPGRRRRRPRSAGCSAAGSPRCRPARPAARSGPRGPSAGEFLHAALSDQVAGAAGGRRHAAHRAARRRPPGPGRRAGGCAARWRPSARCWTETTVTEPLRDELSWLGGELADARDDEVALEHLREVVRGRTRGTGARAGRRPAPADRAHGGAAPGATGRCARCRTPRYLRLLDDLHALLADPPFTPGAEEPLRPVLRDATQRSVKRLRRRLDGGATAEGDGTDARRCTRSARPRSGLGTPPRSARASSRTSRRWSASAKRGADGAGGAPGHRGHPRAVPPARDRRRRGGGERLHLRPAARRSKQARADRAEARLLGARAPRSGAVLRAAAG